MGRDSSMDGSATGKWANSRRARALLAGLITIGIVALTAWGLWSVGQPGKGSATPTSVAISTPTPFKGAATFTPVPGSAATGPRVLGITAGVGMRAGDVAGAAPIAVTFSEEMDQAATEKAFEMRPAVAGDFKWQANTLLFTPKSALAPNTDYTATLASSAKTKAGKPLVASLTASFKSAPPPSVLRTLPSGGASEVPTDTIVTITFNRPMIPLTALDNQPDAGQWVTISPAVSGRWVWLGTSAAGFRADAGFRPSVDYTVEVKAGWPDSAGVPLAQGLTFRFTTIRPAILSISPQNGAAEVPLDEPIVLRFNQPMDRQSVQQAFQARTPSGSTSLQGSNAWSPDGTVMTFTAASLMDFSQDYTVSVRGQVRPAGGDPTDLAGGVSANTWEFSTTDPTQVSGHNPDSSSGPAQPQSSFGFYFNNPLAPNQDVARFLSVSPVPEGYIGQLEVGADGRSVFTREAQLLPNTVYSFELQAGLKDKWGFPVAPSTWTVNVGPYPPQVEIKGGSFQPVYANGPSRVRIEAANLDKLTLHLYQLGEADIRDLFLNAQRFYNPTPTYPGQLKRTWELAISKDKDGKATLYPAIALDATGDRLPAGYYLLRATAPSPYSPELLQSMSVLMVGRSGVVTKIEGRNLLIWAADLGSGKPVANYPLRVEQWRDSGQAGSQRGRTGQDGVLRLKLDTVENVMVTAVWGEQSGDALFATTGWSQNIEPYSLGVSGSYGDQSGRAAIYTDRPIYRPAQVVYYRGVYRADDDASYTLPQAGATVNLRASTYGNEGETVVYTGTATLSPIGTLSGQFTLPASAPTGSYNLTVSAPGARSDGNSYDGIASASFEVEEYRKPDFQVNVTTGDDAVAGDAVTATIQTSYYFGGPLANVTTTVNLQASPYYFSWSDPDTGETYTFGEGGGWYLYDHYRGGPYPYETPEPVQSFQRRTDAAGLLNIEVSRYISTTSGSKSVLIEGLVQDLSNQAVANSAGTVVHQGSYYVGLRVGDYVATAKKPLTITVRTVNSNGERTEPDRMVSLKFVRQEWTAPRYGSSDEWKLTETPAGQASVTTDTKGRVIYMFTPPSGGQYSLVAESTDSRGNVVRSRVEFWAASSEPGYIPWRYGSEQQIKLVADKEQYKISETARILVTSPFTEATALLTVERGHIKRYRVVNLRGGAPTVDVPLEEGDLPNVYISLVLLGTERTPEGAPADWANHVSMRMGYVNLSLDTSSKQVQVSIEPEGKGPFAPGSTANVRVRALDSGGRPVSGEFSLAVVDEAIYALASDGSADLFGAFWGERGVSITTGSSFSAGYGYGSLYGVGRGGAGAMPRASGEMDAAAPPAPAGTVAAEAQDSSNKAGPAAPKKVRADFRDTAFWTASVTTGQDGSAVVPVPLPDNLTTWRLTAQGITADTRAGQSSRPMTVTQPLLLRPVQPRFLTTGDSPQPQAVIHNNTAIVLTLDASLEVSGALTLEAQPPATQRITVQPGAQAVVTWSTKVDAGDKASLRYWVRTPDKSGPDYLEDAVSAELPVKPFAAPEAVATSGEVGGLRVDEGVFIPYSVNPLLGELVVQVSPSLAAATTDSLNYVKEYPYESTDQTVSRFLPLVVLEQVYNEQGLKTPYADEIPGILERSLRRLADLQQPDGGWAWWERGPSNWWETAYAVQGLTAARDAGYAVPGAMLQRGVERLRGFMRDNTTEGIDRTYHLNMRAYTLYVLSYAVGPDDEMRQEASALAAQAPRISNHARAWLAMALAKCGLNKESKAVLDSLAAGAKQSSTTAHWEESAPDYWSMGTDNRATALAIDALVTLAPDDPLIPKAVRWLMTAEKEGHWLSTQETAIALIGLAHYIRQSKELTADYTWQVDAFGKLLGQGVANSSTLTQTTTLRMPISEMPQNAAGNLGLARSSEQGKMYYQMSLRYYVPGEGIKARSEGLAVTRSYYRMTGGATGKESGDPIKEAQAGDLIKVRLMVVVPETSYYVLVTDPLPAGLEGVNGSLNTTSFTERPPDPRGVIMPRGDEYGGLYDWYWRWGPFDNVEMRDDRTVLFASYMSPGTYVYEYFARATTPGSYMSLPAHAELLYYPDVFGHSDGGIFTVR